MAERQLEPFNNIMPGEPLGIEHGLRFELEISRRHLDILVIEGAKRCFPATVLQADQRQNRIIRELRGGLNFDAANDLIVQRKLLARLERQLDHVQLNDVCNSPMSKEPELPDSKGQGIPDELTKKIFNLLNIDNQFASDSSEINPKYIGHLAEAARLLLDLSDYNLLITGHADDVGDGEYNQKLSLQRASQVGRYLKILGLPAERIAIDAVGENIPLSDSKEPHHRLTNRRVSIELIEIMTTMKTALEPK